MQFLVLVTKFLGLFQFLLFTSKSLDPVFVHIATAGFVPFILLRLVVPTPKLSTIQKTHLWAVGPSNMWLWSFATILSHPPSGGPCLRAGGSMRFVLDHICFMDWIFTQSESPPVPINHISDCLKKCHTYRNFIIYTSWFVRNLKKEIHPASQSSNVSNITVDQPVFVINKFWWNQMFLQSTKRGDKLDEKFVQEPCQSHQAFPSDNLTLQGASLVLNPISVYRYIFITYNI